MENLEHLTNSLLTHFDVNPSFNRDRKVNSVKKAMVVETVKAIEAEK